MLNSLLDLIFPPRCEVCRTGHSSALCPDCFKQIQFMKPNLGVNSAATYNGALRQAIQRFKFQKRKRLAEPLGIFLVQYLSQLAHFNMPAQDAIVPVPLHSNRLRQRGFNQTEMLANIVGRYFGKPVLPALARLRDTNAQFDLPRTERFANVAGAFKVVLPDEVKDRRVILIDDIYTTGATVGECARELKTAGARRIELVTLSRAVMAILVFFCLTMTATASYRLDAETLPYLGGDAARSSNYRLAKGSTINEFSRAKVVSSSYSEISGAYAALLSDLVELLALRFSGSTISSVAGRTTPFTNNQTVRIMLDVAGTPYQLLISEYPDFSSAAWQPFAAATSYTFSTPVEGIKTIYARVRTLAYEESETLNADITLDRTAPTLTASLEGRRARSGNVIAAQPQVSAILNDLYLDVAALTIAIDGTTVADGLASGGKYDDWDETNRLLTYQPKSPLTNGPHSLALTAYDYARNQTNEVFVNLQVKGGEPQIVGQVLNYPNPFNPNNEPTTIAYTLSKDANAIINIFSITGQLIWQNHFLAGAEGGRVGYNKVIWNGNSLIGGKAANGIYQYRILAEIDGNKTIIGKGKIAVNR
ncbi:ComF family protein [Candidatus Saganbacteria bacterium]|nr:ComF family protein [Candidatus Saganbacteria bacterium]